MSDHPTAETDPVHLPDSAPAPAAPRRRLRRIALVVDIAAFIAICLAAVPLRWHYTRGDLWLDEADYAFAAVRGFHANRWDQSDTPGEPDKLVRLRHYHPPLVAYGVGSGPHWSPEDRALRVPFVVAGSLTVGLVYLCGIPLFGRLKLRRSAKAGSTLDAVAARIPAVACAIVLLATPAHLRASSHALPWAFITLWLLALVWTLLMLDATARPGWLLAAAVVFGLLFATSEYVIPAAIAFGLALPLVLWPHMRGNPRGVAVSAVSAVLLFLVVAWALWPAGLTGGAVKMLRHYVEMADDTWPVKVRGIQYERAPRTAYLLWYWDLYRTFALFYAAGFVAIPVLLASRRITGGMAALSVFAAVILAVAHKSHIIGPEYLVHALPLLTLLGGLAIAILARLHWTAGLAGAILVSATALTHTDSGDLAGMDDRSQRSRWPQAARFVAAQWKPYTRMLAPAYGGVGRWYVLHVAGAPRKEWQVQGLPPASPPAKDSVVHDVVSGVYQFIAVGSTFSDSFSVDRRIMQIIAKWPVVWKSDEDGTGPSRLLIYKLPRGVNSAHPMSVPK